MVLIGVGSCLLMSVVYHGNILRVSVFIRHKTIPIKVTI